MNNHILIDETDEYSMCEKCYIWCLNNHKFTSISTSTKIYNDRNDFEKENNIKQFPAENGYNLIKIDNYVLFEKNDEIIGILDCLYTNEEYIAKEIIE